MEDLRDHSVVWGRISTSEWRFSWYTQDIGKMHEHDFRDYRGGNDSVLKDSALESVTLKRI